MLFRGLFVVFFCFIVWAIYIADTGQNNVIFDYVKSIPYGDKWGHFFLMGLLAMLANLAMSYRTISLGRQGIWLGSVLIALIVLIEEFSQLYVPIRTFDLGDLFADFVGITFFSWLGYRFLYNTNKSQDIK